MPRPTRIQYPNAFYHVMNRGRGRQTIFHNDEYYQAFLHTLAESHSRFDAIIHSYCLMSNHYHLLIETPRANLDRIMRHINGVYTQRFNRLKRTDGPLFRGRYKAILVEDEAYLLQLGRYIHRNPVEVKGKDQSYLATYPWSSYLAYINKAKPESWLEREKTYQMLGMRKRYAGYKAYVEAGVDDEIEAFYSKGNIASILGGKGFREFIATNESKLQVSGDLSKAVSERPDFSEIVSVVAKVFEVSNESITQKLRGRQPKNRARKVAIYCSQRIGDMPLNEIADGFGFNHTGGVSSAIASVKKDLEEGKLKKEIKLIMKGLNSMKQA